MRISSYLGRLQTQFLRASGTLIPHLENAPWVKWSFGIIGQRQGSDVSTTELPECVISSRHLDHGNANRVGLPHDL